MEKYGDWGGTLVDKYCSIGEYTYIGKNCLVTKAQVGRYCSIGNNVSIGPGEHRLDLISTSAYIYTDRINWYDLLTCNPCCIGNDVWIGTNSVVRRGVVVGDGAVIGANSFVNKDIPSYSIVAGNPARLIRFRFEQEIINELLKLEWWDLPLKEAKEAVLSFENAKGICI